MEDHLLNDRIVNKKRTLSEHIEENQKLITVIGVFTALAIFAKNIEIVQIRTMLSFLFISIAILVCIELSLKKYDNKPTWRLILFDYAILLSVLFLVGYWLITYFETWSSFIIIPMYLSFITIFIYLLKKIKVIRNLNNPETIKFKKIKLTLHYLIFILIIILSMIITSLIKEPFSDFLKEQHNPFINPTSQE